MAIERGWDCPRILAISPCCPAGTYPSYQQPVPGQHGEQSLSYCCPIQLVVGRKIGWYYHLQPDLFEYYGGKDLRTSGFTTQEPSMGRFDITLAVTETS